MKTKRETKPATKPSMNAAGEQQTLNHIRKRAYELLEAGGCQPGNDLGDWMQAEQEIRAQLAQARRAT